MADDGCGWLAVFAGVRTKERGTGVEGEATRRRAWKLDGQGGREE